MDPEGNRVGKVLGYKDSDARYYSVVDQFCETVNKRSRFYIHSKERSEKEFAEYIDPNIDEGRTGEFRDASTLKELIPVYEERVDRTKSSDLTYYCGAFLEKNENIIRREMKKGTNALYFRQKFCHNLSDEEIERNIYQAYLDNPNDTVFEKNIPSPPQKTEKIENTEGGEQSLKKNKKAKKTKKKKNSGPRILGSCVNNPNARPINKSYLELVNITKEIRIERDEREVAEREKRGAWKRKNYADFLAGKPNLHEAGSTPSAKSAQEMAEIYTASLESELVDGVLPPGAEDRAIEASLKSKSKSEPESESESKSESEAAPAATPATQRDEL